VVKGECHISGSIYRNLFVSNFRVKKLDIKSLDMNEGNDMEMMDNDIFLDFKP
jgi:hypothetical protein